MLKIENLTVRYGGIAAVRGVSFEVKQNSIVTLIGNNGAGKTSVLKTISGLVNPGGGKITFNGEDITSMKPHIIARKGLVHIPEGRHIFPDITVMENLMLSSFSRKIKTREFNDEVNKTLDFFKVLKERRNQIAGTLSGGEQQMLAIARGMLQAPSLLMLDEPSMGLAPKIVEEVFEIIKGIKDGGTTILIVEQNASAALSVADYGYVMEVGEIILENDAETLLNDDSIRKIYLGEAD